MIVQVFVNTRNRLCLHSTAAFKYLANLRNCSFFANISIHLQLYPTSTIVSALSISIINHRSTITSTETVQIYTDIHQATWHPPRTTSKPTSTSTSRPNTATSSPNRTKPNSTISTSNSRHSAGISVNPTDPWNTWEPHSVLKNPHTTTAEIPGLSSEQL